jgi:hypothetical protein
MTDAEALAIVRTAFPSARVVTSPQEGEENRQAGVRASGRHMCPAGPCQRQVERDKLMCPAHWQRVPRPVQNAVHATWRGGAGEGSLAHHSAMTAAVRAASR